jgi:alkylhydroperoxidase family enzyme
VAENFGVDPGVIEALLADMESAPVEERLRPIFRLVRRLTLEPAKTTQADAAAILAAGWPETTLAHAVFIAGVFAMMNRIVFGLGIEGDVGYFEQAAGRFHDHGYTALLSSQGECP